MNRFILLLLLGCAASPSTFAQDCPQEPSDGPVKPSTAQTLEGQLIYHDAIRKWFELKLAKPACGRQSIQLVVTDKNWEPLQVLRGCNVKSTGAMDESPTGYYSLDLYQDVTAIEPVGECTKQKPFPDTSGLRPAPDVREYQVEMQVDFEPGDHPIVFRVTSKGKELQPWQAYASYFLTGGMVLFGDCAKGFVVDKVSGPPETSPGHFAERLDPSDRAEFDPEAAASAGKKNMRLVYTCVPNKSVPKQTEFH